MYIIVLYLVVYYVNGVHSRSSSNHEIKDKAFESAKLINLVHKSDDFKVIYVTKVKDEDDGYNKDENENVDVYQPLDILQNTFEDNGKFRDIIYQVQSQLVTNPEVLVNSENLKESSHSQDSTGDQTERQNENENVDIYQPLDVLQNTYEDNGKFRDIIYQVQSQLVTNPEVLVNSENLKESSHFQDGTGKDGNIDVVQSEEVLQTPYKGNGKFKDILDQIHVQFIRNPEILEDYKNLKKRTQSPDGNGDQTESRSLLRQNVFDPLKNRRTYNFGRKHPDLEMAYSDTDSASSDAEYSDEDQTNHEGSNETNNVTLDSESKKENLDTIIPLIDQILHKYTSNISLDDKSSSNSNTNLNIFDDIILNDEDILSIQSKNQPVINQYPKKDNSKTKQDVMVHQKVISLLENQKETKNVEANIQNIFVKKQSSEGENNAKPDVMMYQNEMRLSEKQKETKNVEDKMYTEYRNTFTMKLNSEEEKNAEDNMYNNGDKSDSQKQYSLASTVTTKYYKYEDITSHTNNKKSLREAIHDYNRDSESRIYKEKEKQNSDSIKLKEENIYELTREDDNNKSKFGIVDSKVSIKQQAIEWTDDDDKRNSKEFRFEERNRKEDTKWNNLYREKNEDSAKSSKNSQEPKLKRKRKIHDYDQKYDDNDKNYDRRIIKHYQNDENDEFDEEGNSNKKVNDGNKNINWDKIDNNFRKEKNWNENYSNRNKNFNRDWNKRDDDDFNERKENLFNKKNKWNKENDDWGRENDDWNKNNDNRQRKDKNWNKKDDYWNRKDDDSNVKEDTDYKNENNWADSKNSRLKKALRIDDNMKRHSVMDNIKADKKPKLEWGNYDAFKNLREKKSSGEKYYERQERERAPRRGIKIPKHNSYESDTPRRDNPYKNSNDRDRVFARTSIPFSGNRPLYEQYF